MKPPKYRHWVSSRFSAVTVLHWGSLREKQGTPLSDIKLPQCFWSKHASNNANWRCHWYATAAMPKLGVVWWEVSSQPPEVPGVFASQRPSLNTKISALTKEVFHTCWLIYTKRGDTWDILITLGTADIAFIDMVPFKVCRMCWERGYIPSKAFHGAVSEADNSVVPSSFSLIFKTIVFGKSNVGRSIYTTSLFDSTNKQEKAKCQC